LLNSTVFHSVTCALAFSVSRPPLSRLTPLLALETKHPTHVGFHSTLHPYRSVRAFFSVSIRVHLLGIASPLLSVFGGLDAHNELGKYPLRYTELFAGKSPSHTAHRFKGFVLTLFAMPEVNCSRDNHCLHAVWQALC
jgi:hypothetical protein